MLEEIRKNKNAYLFESIMLIILGILAIILPTLFTYSIEVLVGAILTVGGLVQAVRSCRFIHSRRNIASLVMSLFTLAVGLLLLLFPIKGIIALTFLIGIFFLMEGIVQLYVGYEVRDLDGWVWIIFSGLTSLLLGILIMSELPGSARWVIGLLVGINLLIIGFSQLILISGFSKRPTS